MPMSASPVVLLVLAHPVPNALSATTVTRHRRELMEDGTEELRANMMVSFAGARFVLDSSRAFREGGRTAP